MAIQENPDGTIQRTGLPPEYLESIIKLNNTKTTHIYYLSCEHTPEQIDKLKTMEEMVIAKVSREQK